MDTNNAISTSTTTEKGEDIQKSSGKKTLPHNVDIFLELNRDYMDRIVEYVFELENNDWWVKLCKWLSPFISAGALTCLLQFFCNGQKIEWIIAALILILISVVSYIVKYKKENNDENSIKNLNHVIEEISINVRGYKTYYNNVKKKFVQSKSRKKGGELKNVIVVSLLSLCVLSSCNMNYLDDTNDSLVLSIGIAIISLLISLFGLVALFIEKKKAMHYYEIIDKLKYDDTGDVDASKAFFVLGNSMKSQGYVSDAIVYYTKAINEVNDKPEYYENRGEAYWALDSIKEAQDDYQKAIDLYKTSSADMFQITQLMHELANLYLQTKDFEKAERCFQNAIASFEENDKALDKLQIGEFVDVLNDYGNMLINLNKLEEAELIFNKASDCCDKLTDETEKSLASKAMTLNNMAILYKKTFQFKKAEEKYNKALGLYRQLANNNENAYIQDVAMTLNNLGNLHVTEYDYDKAENELEEALEIRRKLAERDGDTYNADVATTLNNLANLKKEAGRYDEAEQEYLEALSIREKVLEPEHPDIAATYNNISELYFTKGDYDKSLEYNFKALAIREKVLGKEHPDTAESYNNIGGIYNALGDYDKSLEYYFKALAIREKVLGKGHPDTAGSYNNIGIVYSDQGDYDKSLEYYFKDLSISEKVLGTEHPDTATSYNNIGTVYDDQGNYDKALEYYQKALEIREKVLGTEHPDTADSYNNIGETYREQGDYDKSLEYNFKALTIREKVLGTEHPDTAASYFCLGAVYYHLKDFNTSLEYLNKAHRVYEKVLGPEHPNTKNVLGWIVGVKKALG